MRSMAPAARAALEAGEAIEAGAVAIFCDPVFATWGGWGDLTIVIPGIGPVVHKGNGDRTMVQETGGGLGGAEQGFQIALSGVDPDNDPLDTATGVRGAPAIIHRLIFDGTGANLLDTEVRGRGRLDEMPRTDTPGGTSTITLKIEGAARGAGRQGARARTDADQRLINGNDGGFRRISHAGDVTLNWGGKKPERAGVAMGGSFGNGLLGRAVAARTRSNNSNDIL